MSKGYVEVDASCVPMPIDEEFIGRNNSRDAGTESFDDYTPDDFFGSESESGDLFH